MLKKKKNQVKQKLTAAPKRSAQFPVAILDIFSAEDIARWAKNAVAAQSCLNAMHFDLEMQRVSRHKDLIAALQSVDSKVVSLDHWVRVLDWQWGLAPLATIGSIKGIGGRFNFGKDLSVMRRQEFPCLYIASNFDTGMRERFGAPLEEEVDGLQIQEYGLRRPSSFCMVDLHGQVIHVFDLTNRENLQRFMDIVATFSFSKRTIELFKKLNQKLPVLVRTVDDLAHWLLAKPEQWRQMPNAFGVPSPSQIFGWFLREAGFEAVLYPSQQGGELCLAVFPENFVGSNSVVEVTGSYPTGATCTVLDRNHLCLLA